MLLVASETGHVYTFATRKLQPMITSDAGKALIQTCLNSPDPTPPGAPPGTGVSGGSSSADQRMSATGYEETELTYNVADEEQQKVRQMMYNSHYAAASAAAAAAQHTHNLFSPSSAAVAASPVVSSPPSMGATGHSVTPMPTSHTPYSNNVAHPAPSPSPNNYGGGGGGGVSGSPGHAHSPPFASAAPPPHSQHSR